MMKLYRALTTTAAVALLGLALCSCGSDECSCPAAEGEAGEAGCPVNDRLKAGKADFLNGLDDTCEYVHQSSNDLTLLKAELVGRAAPSSNTVPADFNVDCSKCVVLSEEESSAYDCQFYDVCKELSIDCKAELESMTGMPFITDASFDRVSYVKTSGYPGGPEGPPREAHESYYTEQFNCQVLEITVASRDPALPEAKGIGFWFEDAFSFIAKDKLVEVGTATLKDGTAATLHKFGALAVCWRGSMSSSSSAVYEFKPFMKFEAEGKCYFNWDTVADNYLISSSVKSIDRSAEVLE